MIVKLTLLFILAIHLRHLLEALKHGLNNSIIGLVNMLPDFEGVGANEETLYAANVCREVLDEWGNTISLLACQLSIFDRLDMFVLLKCELQSFVASIIYLPPVCREVT